MKYFKHFLIILIFVTSTFAQNKYSSEEWKKLSVQQRWEAMNIGKEKHDACIEINETRDKVYYGGNAFISKAIVLDKLLSKIKKNTNISHSTLEMDLSKLSKKEYSRIIHEAKGL